jgi:hypothetical protein
MMLAGVLSSQCTEAGLWSGLCVRFKLGWIPTAGK